MYFLFFLFLLGCGSGGGDTTPAPIETTAKPPLTAPPPSPMVTWSFHGHLVDSGTVEGTVSYDTTEGPYALNLNKLDNAVYKLATWHITVTPTAVDPTPVVFTHTDTTQEAHLCQGQCIFSDLHFRQLYFMDGPHRLSLLWGEGYGDNILLDAKGDWGNFAADAAQYRVFLSATEYIWQVTDGTIVAVEN